MSAPMPSVMAAAWSMFGAGAALHQVRAGCWSKQGDPADLHYRSWTASLLRSLFATVHVPVAPQQNLTTFQPRVRSLMGPDAQALSVDGDDGDDEAPAEDDGLDEGEPLKLETVISQVGRPTGLVSQCL
jgi:hypothetical protein